MHKPAPSRFVSKQQGFALVLVLAFIALLVGIGLAFLSNSLLQRQVSDSSANIAKADILAQGAVDTTIGDLKSEIIAGSTATAITPTPATGSANIYQPKAVGTTPPIYPTMMPALQGVAHGTATAPNGLENLLKVSASGKPFYSGTGFAGNGPTRASAVDTITPSQNGRYIDVKRWNSPLFLQPKSATDFTPAAATFPVVNWIYVANDGTNPTTMTNPQNITGRYAYAIYDEGGLLDINVAGYPDTLTTNNMSNGAMYRKIGMSYVNLQDLKDPSAPTNSLFQQSEAKLLTDWRDYATGQAVSSSSLSTKEGAYATTVFSNRSGFLQTAPAIQGTLSNGQTDQKFVGRQQLIDFVINKLHSTGTLTALQYLTTFSRDLNQPSYIPAIQTDPNNAPRVLQPSAGGNSSTFGSDQLINPNFLTTRVQNGFNRNDGTRANPGDPLVNKRFPLVRLAWVTYRGPSHDRSQSDPDIQALINNGIPWSYLQQGTAQNIENYFGLRWDNSNNRWLYIHNGGGTGTGAIMKVGRPSGTGPDPATYIEDANRDPDFFELLKAGISVGSLGKSAWTPTSPNNQTPIDNSLPREQNQTGSISYPVVPGAYNVNDVPVNVRYKLDSSVDYQIIQIGANIINETSPASYPIRIAFNDGGSRGLWDILGVTDIPYLEYVFNGVLKTAAPISNPAKNFGQTDGGNSKQYPVRSGESLTSPGNAYVVQVPAVWNPYDPNGTRGVARPTQFRVIVDSNDPVILHSQGSSSNKSIFCAAVATGNTQATGAGNAGYLPQGGPSVYSYNVPQGAPHYGTSPNGRPIHDAVDFTGDAAGLLFREPTLIVSRAVGNATRETGPIPAVVESSLPGGQTITSWAPLVLGQVPLAFLDDVDYPTPPNTVWTGTMVIGPGLNNAASATGDYRVYFTYSLQYQDSGGQWVTYDMKYGRTTNGRFSFQTAGNSSNSVITGGPNAFCPSSWAAAVDPRSGRYGLMLTSQDARRSGTGYSWPPPGSTWSYGINGSPSTTACISLTPRPDQNGGFALSNIDMYDQINIWPINGGQYPGGRSGAWNPGTTLMEDVPYPSFSAGWTRSTSISTGNGQNAPTPVVAPGMYAQNNPNVPLYPMRYNGVENPPAPYDTIASPAYYADADGVIRRAAGAYIPVGNVAMSASSPIGLPTASIYGFSTADTQLKTPPTAGGSFVQAQSRPLLLHRPFRSVAELGYVFRDDPWKNLSFFTPESGDAALLDIFCINEVDNANAVVAGKVNLNTRQAAVLGAIVNEAYIDDPKAGTDPTVGSIAPNSNLGSRIATAVVTRTADTNSYGPFSNISELIGKWRARTAVRPGIAYNPTPGANANVDLPLGSPNNGYVDGQTSYTGFSGAASNAATSGNPENLSDAIAASSLPTQLKTGLSQIQRFREAPIRALASAGQTRVWNLMIDVVAQAGRMPQTASGLDKFAVSGERRYWVHVAIDRLTGNVIDKQVEVVKE